MTGWVDGPFGIFPLYEREISVVYCRSERRLAPAVAGMAAPAARTAATRGRVRLAQHSGVADGLDHGVGAAAGRRAHLLDRVRPGHDRVRRTELEREVELRLHAVRGHDRRRARRHGPQQRGQADAAEPE